MSQEENDLFSPLLPFCANLKTCALCLSLEKKSVLEIFVFSSCFDHFGLDEEGRNERGCLWLSKFILVFRRNSCFAFLFFFLCVIVAGQTGEEDFLDASTTVDHVRLFIMCSIPYVFISCLFLFFVGYVQCRLAYVA